MVKAGSLTSNSKAYEKKQNHSQTVSSHRHSVSERLILYYPIVNKRPLWSVLKPGRAPLSRRKHTVNALCDSSSCKLNFGARLDSKHLIIPRHLMFPNGTRSHCRTSDEKRKKNTGPFTSIYRVGRSIQAPPRCRNLQKQKYKWFKLFKDKTQSARESNYRTFLHPSCGCAFAVEPRRNNHFKGRNLL